MLGPFSGAVVCAQYKIDPLNWPKMTPAERALFRMAYAADVAKVQEEPRGSNTGPEVNRILALADLEPGNPWCASNWTAYLIDSGVAREELPDLAGLVHGLDGSWAHWAKQKKLIIHEPKRGAAGLIFHGPRSGHLVAIAGMEGKHNVRTIEGNSNDEGSREGYEVCRLVRHVDSIDLFVDCTLLKAR